MGMATEQYHQEIVGINRFPLEPVEQFSAPKEPVIEPLIQISKANYDAAMALLADIARMAARNNTLDVEDTEAVCRMSNRAMAQMEVEVTCKRCEQPESICGEVKGDICGSCFDDIRQDQAASAAEPV